jgi:hypothetical protein
LAVKQPETASLQINDLAAFCKIWVCGLAMMPDDWSDEETDDPTHADRRNFYKVEQ